MARLRLPARTKLVLGVPLWAWPLGALLMGVGFVLIYLLVALWPAVSTTGTTNAQQAAAARKIVWFGWSLSPSRDAALLILVVIAASVGSFVHAATSFSDFAGTRKLSPSWIWWYLLRVFVGSALAIIFYFAVRGGFLTTTGDSKQINPYGIAALSGLVGMFSKQATMKLSELFDTLFRAAPGYGEAYRTDSITSPGLTSANPAKLEVGATERSISLIGSGFTDKTEARVARGDGAEAPRPTTFVNEGELKVDLREADVAEPGTLRISVFAPPPGGGASSPLTVEVVAKT